MWKRILTGLIALGVSTVVLAEPLWPDLSSPPEGQGEGKGDAALIVGIGDYYQLSDIPGASENAKDWYRYLTASRGVPAGNIKLLIDAEATREEILASAKLVAGKVQPEGTLWLVYIGHGAPSQDGADGVLVGADALQTVNSLYARSLTREELLKELEAAGHSRRSWRS